MTDFFIIMAALYLIPAALTIRHLERNDPHQPLWMILVGHVLPGLLWLPIAIAAGAITLIIIALDEAARGPDTED